MLDMFDLTAQQAELHPLRLALRDVSTGQTLTYAQLNQRATALAASFQARGYRAGERIAILCHNCAAFFEVLFACAKARLILVPLNWRLAPQELERLLEDCTPRLLLHDTGNAELAHRCGPTGDLARLELGEAYQRLIREAPQPQGLREVWGAEEIWYLLYTSGTTGTPKAVIQTFGMAMANYINLVQAIDLSRQDRTLNFLPLFHTAGISLYSLPHLIAGGSVVIHRQFDPALVLRELASGITTLFAVPAIYQALCQHPDFATSDLSGVRSWGCGGAPLSASLIQAYAARQILIRPGFGMTETGPTVFLMEEAYTRDKPASVGKPLLLNQARIVDRAGQAVAAGEAGELLLRGPGITPGYWNRPEATALALEGDGWLHTGDVARVDAEGFYYIVDRWKDMYISGGENVYPAEVERVLERRPEVLEAAVVGVADERWGEVGCAFVVPLGGAAVDGEQLRLYCRDQLAHYKVPKSVRVVEALPRNAAGKVQKHQLQALLQQTDREVNV